MPEILHDAPAHASHDLPFAIDLELRIEDRDVIAALAAYADGPEREQYALEALKIGVLALRRASAAMDGEFIQRETTRLLHSMRENLDHHARAAHERLTHSLKEYFDPESGRFSQRVRRLTADDGELATLLRGLLDGDDSRLAKTLLSHVGENSALMKHLSPDQSQGLLALLGTTVETQLGQQRDRLLKEFSLDNAEGALCRLVKELTAKHGDLSKDLQTKIDVVVKEFSLDEENSALTRLVRNVDRAQRTITSEFSLDNEQSALCRLKAELMTILKAHVETNAEFQEAVKVSLAQLTTKREQELRSTLHGISFENAVYAFIDAESRRRGDIPEDTSGSTGLIKGCKIGDAVIQLGQDCAAAGARIVIESKEVIGYSLRDAKEEIEKARKNRDAQQGVFVFSQRTAPPIDSVFHQGDDVFVVWNPEDTGTDVNLNAGLAICRALCLRSRRASQQQRVDFEPISKAIRDIETSASKLEEVDKFANSIKTSADKILDRVRKDREKLEKCVTVLDDAFANVKHQMGENGLTEAGGV